MTTATTKKTGIFKQAADELGIKVINHALVTNPSINNIEVGDLVRSYDFNDIDDCYVEGIVIEMGVRMQGSDRYKIAPVKSVQNGEECPDSLRLNHFIYPPVNGTQSWMGGVTNCVKRIRRISDDIE